jgi:hypothetical protein
LPDERIHPPPAGDLHAPHEVVPGPATGEESPPAPAPTADEPSPLFGTWDVLYAVVIAALAVMIVLCAMITGWGASQ